MSELVKTLRNYADSDYLPMHMPGHKRRLGAGEMGDPFFIDITEIEGTDNLHHAEGVLKYVQEHGNTYSLPRNLLIQFLHAKQ